MKIAILLLFFLGSILFGADIKVADFDGRDWSKVAVHQMKVDGYKELLKLQCAIHKEKLSIRVRIPQENPSMKHRPWVLKDEKFVVGKQLEDSLALRFSQKGKEIQDLWFWGANRTQWGVADDGFFKDKKYFSDGGKGPWKLNLELGSFHQNRNRYLEQKSQGSRSDVSVKSDYKEGAWELVFSRSIRTINKDDLSFDSLLELTVSKDPKVKGPVMKLTFEGADK
ncbi:hypothetical protein PQO03_01145 [Lentisphaera profundi]|uniref:Uncharacterized protein n=1 Tax=Lentisphaera profundi TaxID=1658616 RepID=A0ABY7VRB9_9BACT|nr:hypothetical protein [Lentisphaera profundi]WDE96572.1 hypothetical protein PQO03_01145 [Lentisphaera profundi]